MASLNGNYISTALPSDIFNSNNGDIKNWQGHAVKITNPGNGTRDITDLGDWNTYQNNQQVDQQNQQNQQNFNNLVGSNTKAVTDFLGNYKTDVANAQNEANTKYNVPQFENLVSGLSNRITDLQNNTSNSGGGSVGATGAGGFSNAGQVDTALSSRYLPELNTAEQNLTNAGNLAQQYVQQSTQPDQAYASLLSNNISTAMQGLTATQQQALQGIIAKLNAGVTLTSQEMQTGEQYAQAVLNNANAITLENMKNAYTPIGQGATLIDPTTGKIINPGILAANGSYTP